MLFRSHGWAGHLSAGDHEYDLRMVQAADVLTRAGTGTEAAAWEWTRHTLARFPGSVLACASVQDGCVATFRDGRRVVASGGDLDATARAAGLYALAHAGSLHDGNWRLRSARNLGDLAVRLLPRI